MPPVEAQAPRIVIMGSPNVGKSTLFNRLLRRRRAITDAVPGVTRDAVEATLTIGQRHYTLVDTGGYVSSGGDGLSEAVSDRSLETGRSADLILLMIDISRLNADDQDFIEELRPSAARVIVVVNKVDSEERESEVWNLLSLGFDRIVAVSAAHGRNIDQLKTHIEEALADWEGASPEPVGAPSVRIAIMGKPNTGKSTFLNRLVGHERALVSEIPGTTRDVVEGQFTHKGVVLRVLDTAGIRRKGKVTENIEYYSVNRAIQAIKEVDVVVLMIDVVDGLADQDKKIASLAVREGRGVVLALNKWDLLADVPNRLQAVKDRVRFLFPVLSFAPLIEMSAHTGHNLQQVLDAVLIVHEQLNRRISTSELNQSLARWIEANPPSARYNVKIRYVTQISSNPLRFVFFVNRQKGLPEAYPRYLLSCLRETYNLDQVPIDVQIRASRE